MCVWLLFSTLCLWDASSLVQIAVHFYCWLVCCNLSIHHTLDGQLGCFQLRLIMKNDIINILACILWLTNVCLCQVSVRNGIGGSEDRHGFLSRYCEIVLQSGCPSAQFWQLCMGESWLFQVVGIGSVGLAAILLDAQCCSVVHFICIFLLPVEVKVLFTCLLTIGVYLLVICLPGFSHWVFCRFLTYLQDS